MQEAIYLLAGIIGNYRVSEHVYSAMATIAASQAMVVQPVKGKSKMKSKVEVRTWEWERCGHCQANGVEMCAFSVMLCDEGRDDVEQVGTRICGKGHAFYHAGGRGYMKPKLCKSPQCANETRASQFFIEKVVEQVPVVNRWRVKVVGMVCAKCDTGARTSTFWTEEP
jgi:hypothetical protein